MNNKGFAVSGVIYTILIICLTSMVILLGTFNNRKTILDTIKRETFESLNDSITNETIGSPIVIGGSTEITESKTYTIIDPESVAGINYYQYYITDAEADIPYKATRVSGASTTNNGQITITTTGTYIYFRAISMLGTIGEWSIVSNLYVHGVNYCSSNIGDYWDFDYTGNIETWEAPCSGTYKLEVYGAQGYCIASSGSCSACGKGGYSSGNIVLTKDENIYVVVGGSTTGYNGGGKKTFGDSGYGTSSHTGGGATHISSTDRGILSNYSSYRSELFIVAGGGGSGGLTSYSYIGGAGGSGGNTSGGNGGAPQNTGSYTIGIGATQTTGNAFGLGSSSASYYGGTGGGGFFGGKAAYNRAGGGGGSGYLSTSLSNTSATSGVQYGNGYAKITLTEIDGVSEVNPYIIWEMDDTDFLSNDGVTYTGSPTASAGILTYYAPASSEYSVTYNMDMRETTDLKVAEARIYIASNSTGEFRLYISDSKRRTFLIFNGLSKTGKIQYYNRSGVYVDIATGINFSGWHKYKVELDSVNGMKIYMDDVQVGSTVSYTLLRDSTSEVYGFSTRIGTIKVDWFKMKDPTK